MTKEIIKNVLLNYELEGEFFDAVPYGEGHINVTFLITYKVENNFSKYILQKINDHILHPVDKLMNNIVLVTEHCRRKITENKGDPHRETINILFTKDNKPFAQFDGGFYRLMEFIDNCIALQTIEKPVDFYNCALAFGKFYKMLEDFDASNIFEIIPNFHNTVSRFKDFVNAVNEDKVDRKCTCENEIKFILEREKYCNLIVSKLKNKELPLRVTHNDTKLNNVLFDTITHKPVAVIDLDTIMPGSLCYDFGDSIRFGCNSAAEDEKDLSKVYFRLDLYETYLKGFLEALGNKITQEEKNMLGYGSILMTLECGMRFLADYLEGDHYFHTKYSDHNLIRCRTQLKLVEGMEDNLEKMNLLAK